MFFELTKTEKYISEVYKQDYEQQGLEALALLVFTLPMAIILTCLISLAFEFIPLTKNCWRQI